MLSWQDEAKGGQVLRHWLHLRLSVKDLAEGGRLLIRLYWLFIEAVKSLLDWLRLVSRLRLVLSDSEFRIQSLGFFTEIFC